MDCKTSKGAFQFTCILTINMVYYRNSGVLNDKEKDDTMKTMVIIRVWKQLFELEEESSNSTIWNQHRITLLHVDINSSCFDLFNTWQIFKTELFTIKTDFSIYVFLVLEYYICISITVKMF